MAGAGGDVGNLDPAVMKMIAAAPLAKLTAFSPGMSADLVTDLVDRVRAQSS
jgi:hypothetical protein